MKALFVFQLVVLAVSFLAMLFYDGLIAAIVTSLYIAVSFLAIWAVIAAIHFAMKYW